MTTLDLDLGGETVSTEIHNAIVAGWAGRDTEAVERHIAELEELGVPRPSATPLFYRVSAARVTTDREIESTAAASGEVEAVLLRSGGRLWVGVGSDHTDRDVESYSVAVSKELCMKPIARSFWPYEEVKGRWDKLVLRSWIYRNGAKFRYQEGSLEALLSAEYLLAASRPSLTDGSIMFCGTLAALGPISPSTEFCYELEDPIARRSLHGRYTVRPLTLVS